MQYHLALQLRVQVSLQLQQLAQQLQQLALEQQRVQVQGLQSLEQEQEERLR